MRTRGREQAIDKGVVEVRESLKNGKRADSKAIKSEIEVQIATTYQDYHINITQMVRVLDWKVGGGVRVFGEG